LEAIAEVAPEFTALPKRDAPVPSAAPRAADEVLVAVIEPVDPLAVKAAEDLAIAEIAAIDSESSLPKDAPVPTPRPIVAIAAAEPDVTAQGVAAPSVDIASLSADPQAEPGQAEMRAAFAPVPEAAPTRDAIADLASVPLPVDDLAAKDGAVEMASLPDQGPIPELRVDELSAAPEPALVKPAARATGVIGANLKTGVKTTGKSAKLLTAKIVRKPAVQALEPALPVNPDRFGPSSDQTASNDTPKSKKNGKGPRILPDGSAVVSSGTIQP
jgi:hypothetical protein